MPSYVVNKLCEEFAAGPDRTGLTSRFYCLGSRTGPASRKSGPPRRSQSPRIRCGRHGCRRVDLMLDSFEEFQQRGVTQIDLQDVYDRQFDGVVPVTPHDEFESIRRDMKQPDGI